MDNEELTLFRDMARRAFEQEISPHYEGWEEQHMVPRELWNTLGEAGLLCADMPEEYGGAGTSPHVTLALIEELSRMGFGGVCTGYGIHCNIVAPYINHFGTEEQKQQWLPKMVSGEAVGALAMTVGVYFLLSESAILGYLLGGVMAALILYFILAGIKSGDKVQLPR